MVSTEPAATPRVATRRVARFSPRPTYGSPLPRKVGRPPLVLEWSSSFLRVGYAEQAQPQHILPIPALDNTISNSEKGESQWYNFVSPLVRHMYDRLMVDPTQRRVVCVTRAYPVRAWEQALQQALWNVGVPAVTFLNSLEVVPVALGWKRGMVVHVGRDEAQCLAYVDGHPLAFTYQAVPSGYASAVADPTKLETQWTPQMDRVWLHTDGNPNSLLVAVLKCLEACPRDTRKDVVHNLLVCGDAAVVVPDLGRRMALALKEVLQQRQPEPTPESAQPQEKEEGVVLNYVPVSITQLQPLADHVGVISCAPHRPDRISWVGASVFATIWHRQDEQDAQVPWIFSPTAKTAE